MTAMTETASLLEFYGNPDPRCPCALVLDTSGSMRGPRIDALNQALVQFRDDLMADPLALRRVEVAAVTFNTEVILVQDFVTPDRMVAGPLRAKGETQMAPALHQALDLLERRTALYRQAGTPGYTPWVFLVTDGRPHKGFCAEMRRAAARIAEAESRRRLAFFAVGVQEADMDLLGKLAVRQAVKLQGLRFREMFLWLSQSLRSVSQSRVGERVPLVPPGWAETP